MKEFKRALLCSGLAALLALTSTAVSADGFYVGAGAYKTEIDLEDYSDDDTVPAAFVGYQFLDTNFLMLSAELGYYDLGDYSEFKLGNDYSVDADALTLAGVVYIPIGPFFEIYAKAGAASVSVDYQINGVRDDADGTEAFGGLGFAFDIFDTIDIYAEYLIFDTEVDSEMFGVGVRFDFF
jgi:hypothetical protein